MSTPALSELLEPEHHVADSAGSWVWFLTSDELAATRARIAKVNARAERKGLTGRVDVAAVPATRSYAPAPGAPQVTVHGFDVTLTGEPPSYAGWRFVAAVDRLPGEAAPPVLRYPPGSDETVDNASVQPGQCDHCHTVRPRLTTYLVRHEDTGELKQIGRNCLPDFLGITVRPVILSADDLEAEIERSRGGGPTLWDIDSVLTYAYAVTAVYGWTPASNPNGRTPTRELVALAMGGSRQGREVLSEITDQLADATQKAPQIRTDLLASLTGASGYEANLAAVLAAGIVGRKQLGLAVSAIRAWQRLTQRQAETELRDQQRPTISHVGTIGEKVTLSGTVSLAMAVAGYHYRSPDQMLLVIDCETAVAKTTTSARWAYDVQRGDQLTITGTVKKHDDYRGIPQTVLSRPQRTTITTPPPLAGSLAQPAPGDESWEVVNANEAGPRPFPRPSNALAQAPQTPNPAP